MRLMVKILKALGAYPVRLERMYHRCKVCGYDGEAINVCQACGAPK